MFGFDRDNNFAPLNELIKLKAFNDRENIRLFNEIYSKNHFRNVLPDGANYNYKKFMVLASQRTGSTFLINLLRSHSGMVCYNEVFLKNSKPTWGFYEINEEIYRKSLKYPVKYLNHYYFRNYSDSIQAVGFKLMYNQLNGRQIKKLINDAFNENDLIIHLKRKNKLRAFLSVKLTERFKVYELYIPRVSNIMRNKSEININEPVYIDKKEFIDYTKKTLIKEKYFDSFLANKRNLTIYYHELEKNYLKQTDIIIHELGLPVEELVNINMKMVNKPLSYMIMNYEELKKELINTKFGEYFDE